jgi:hypothetical protein
MKTGLNRYYGTHRPICIRHLIRTRRYWWSAIALIVHEVTQMPEKPKPPASPIGFTGNVSGRGGRGEFVPIREPSQSEKERLGSFVRILRRIRAARGTKPPRGNSQPL